MIVTTARCRPALRQQSRWSTVDVRQSWRGDVDGSSAGSVSQCRRAGRQRDVPMLPTPRRTYSDAVDTRWPPLSHACINTTNQQRLAMHFDSAGHRIAELIKQAVQTTPVCLSDNHTVRDCNQLTRSHRDTQRPDDI